MKFDHWRGGLSPSGMMKPIGRAAQLPGLGLLRDAAPLGQTVGSSSLLGGRAGSLYSVVMEISSQNSLSQRPDAV